MEITELYDLNKMIVSLEEKINDPTIEWEDRGELAFNIQLYDWLEELRDLRSKAQATKITNITIANFIIKAKQDVLDAGGTQAECNLITPQMAIDAIRCGRNPSDVAWAVMQ